MAVQPTKVWILNSFVDVFNKETFIMFVSASVKKNENPTINKNAAAL